VQVLASIHDEQLAGHGPHEPVPSTSVGVKYPLGQGAIQVLVELLKRIKSLLLQIEHELLVVHCWQLILHWSQVINLLF